MTFKIILAKPLLLYRENRMWDISSGGSEQKKYSRQTFYAWYDLN